MISLSDLPAVNASLNALSAVCLCLGYAFIRRRRVNAHRVCMIAAFAISTLFLAGYLTYHAHHLTKKFTGEGWVRGLYFAILISHSILAAAALPMALVTVWRALRGRFDKHKQIARWTWPIWLYVSITGVAVYWMLYHLAP